MEDTALSAHSGCLQSHSLVPCGKSSGRLLQHDSVEREVGGFGMRDVRSVLANSRACGKKSKGAHAGGKVAHWLLKRPRHNHSIDEKMHGFIWKCVPDTLLAAKSTKQDSEVGPLRHRAGPTTTGEECRLFFADIMGSI